MKLKIAIAFILFCISTISFGQGDKSYTEMVKNIDSKINEGLYNADVSVTADKLVIETPKQNINNKNEAFFSEEEWIKIKKQIKENKKNTTGIEHEIHQSKVLDTIFLYIPSINNQIQLSNW